MRNRVHLFNLAILYGVGWTILIAYCSLRLMGSLEQQYSFDFARFIYWLWLDQGAALLGGIAAGCIFAAALNAITSLGHVAKYPTIGMLALGPAVSILALCFLTVPGLRQDLGITSIKVPDIELQFAPTSPNTTPVTSLSLPVSTMPVQLGDQREYTPWFRNLWPMFLDSNGLTQADFMKRPYFQREAGFVNYIGGLWDSKPETITESGDEPTGHIARALWTQQRFLISLRATVGCGAYYHKIFHDQLALRALTMPFLETLVAIELDLETMPSDDGGYNEDINKRLNQLHDRANDIIVYSKAAIPRSAQSIESDLTPNKLNPPSWSDCTHGVDDLLPSSSSLSSDLTIVPPYLAMFIANSYAAFEAKDDGLKVLNSWIEYYNKYRAKHPENSVQWFYHRALLEYGNIQETDEAYPTTTAERYYLQKIQQDWETLHMGRFDLKGDGSPCDEPPAAVPEVIQIRTRLNFLYSNILQRFLQATVATRAALEGESITVEHERLGRQLIAAADTCLPGEDKDSWESRQSLDREAGGITLARWADDGPRTGFLRASEVADVQKSALKAL
jgi:hypothetical protein